MTNDPYRDPSGDPTDTQAAQNPPAAYPDVAPFSSPDAAPYPAGAYPASAYPAGAYPAGAYPTTPVGAYPAAPVGPYPGGYQVPGAHEPQPAGPARGRRGRRRLLITGIGVLAAGAVAAGVAVADGGGVTIAGAGSSVQLPSTGGSSSGTGGGTLPGTLPGGTLPGTLPGGTLPGTLPGGSLPGGTGGSGTATSASIATAAQTRGVVTIVSVLKYQSAESAGTGMILTSNGEILTNNHVINGATSITVTVESTGKSYRAAVVGTDPTADVAVLQLRNASGLTTAGIDSTPDVSVGDPIIGVGNAGGTGTLRASAGKVTALKQAITASDDDGTNAEKLRGLIEVDAAIISGDSGGPMYDSSGKIIGMNTAASSSRSASTAAYAIPIDNALAVAAQIEKGIRTSTIHIGLPGFIGVGVGEANGTGAAITSVLSGGPAETAGITTGSVITRVGGTRVTSAATLKTALTGRTPGTGVRITWTGLDGASHSATVTLTAGPAD